MFPKLDDGQIAQLAAIGGRQDAQPYEVILERGDLHHGIFVVLSSRIEVLRVGSLYERI
jgi:CRP-like cAMP-binding protein